MFFPWLTTVLVHIIEAFLITSMLQLLIRRNKWDSTSHGDDNLLVIQIIADTVNGGKRKGVHNVHRGYHDMERFKNSHA